MAKKVYEKEAPRMAKVTKPKGRQMKKFTIEADGKEIMKQNGILVIGLDQIENAVQLNIQGRITFEEVIDMLNTAQYELLATFLNAASKGDPLGPPVDFKQLKRDIYDRAVLGFSLMIDKFLPEAKDDKYAGMTDQAVLEAQNASLKKRIEAKKAKA